MPANTIELEGRFEEVASLVRKALSDQGFGILTEADIAATFATKLGEREAAELGDYLIFGACNPQLALRALRADPAVGVFLPCGVVVRRPPGAPRVTVEAVDPVEMIGGAVSTELEEVARDAAERLAAALHGLERDRA